MKRDLKMSTVISRCYLIVCGFLLASRMVSGQDVLEEEASWDRPTDQAIRGQLLSLADAQNLAPESREQLEELWAGSISQPTERLGVVLRGFTILHPDLTDFVDRLQVSQSPFSVPDLSRLGDESLPGWVRDQLTLAAGTWLTQNRLFDEAIEILEPLETEQVCEPAMLLFYRGVACQQLIRKDAAVENLSRLMEREGQLPRRFQQLGRLMLADLEGLEDDSLNEIARMMDDIHRRQSLYRSGTRVRDEEARVIEKLDKLIEELEEQQQQMSSVATNAPSSPAPDSMLKSASAPGEVDRKAQGSGADWGDLPDKERAAAMAELAKDLPSHYRELIEEYYRKLAEDPSSRDQ